MKKSMIVLAALGAFAGAASAQSSVTLFGTLDPSVQNAKTTFGDGSSKNQSLLGNDGRGTTQVSVKGTTDLGGGLSGIFLYEGDINVASSTGVSAAGTSSGFHTVGSRGGEIFGGLAGGFGSIKLGSPNTPTLNSQASRQPIGTKIGSGFGSSLGTSHVRNNNSLRYDTPNLGGVVISGAYAFKSQATQSVASITTTADIGSIYDLGVDAAFGPIKLGLTQYGQQKANTQLSNHTQTNVYFQYLIGGSTIYAGFDTQKDPAAGDKSSGANVAAKIDVGGGVYLIANAAKKNDKSVANNDITTVALGGEYALGKQTVLYARLVNEKTSNVAATATAVAKVNTVLVGIQNNF